jgi:nicotinate-nucleotide adenylyltransferase
MSRRIGIFGGTFDPPHLGHMAVARAALQQLNLHHVEWVVSAQPPHRGAPSADRYDRLAMVTLATCEDPAMHPSARELRRGGTSYTVDTLNELLAEFPGAELVLVIGADSLDELPTWREPDTIRRLAQLAVVPRCGAGPAPTDGAEDPRVTWLKTPEVPIAARELRRRLARGDDPLDAIHPLVLGYLRKRALYIHDEGAR